MLNSQVQKGILCGENLNLEIFAAFFILQGYNIIGFDNLQINKMLWKGLALDEKNGVL